MDCLICKSVIVDEVNSCGLCNGCLGLNTNQDLEKLRSISEDFYGEAFEEISDN